MANTWIIVQNRPCVRAQNMPNTEKQNSELPSFAGKSAKRACCSHRVQVPAPTWRSSLQLKLQLKLQLPRVRSLLASLFGQHMLWYKPAYMHTKTQIIKNKKSKLFESYIYSLWKPLKLLGSTHTFTPSGDRSWQNSSYAWSTAFRHSQGYTEILPDKKTKKCHNP